MKVKFFITIIFLFVSFQTYALKWHDELIEIMLQETIRDKDVIVERDEKTLKIKRAIYRFSFVKDNLADKIRSILYAHSNEAHKFSSEGNDVLMQVKEEPDTYYTYKLGTDPYKGRYQLLISVNNGKNKKNVMTNFFYDESIKDKSFDHFETLLVVFLDNLNETDPNY